MPTKAKSESRGDKKRKRELSAGPINKPFRGQPTKRQLKPLAERNLQRAERLLLRMYYFAHGKPDENGHEVDMTATQLQAAKIIIDRSVPTLKSVEMNVNETRRIETTDEVKMKVLDMMAKDETFMHLLLQKNPNLLNSYGVSEKVMEPEEAINKNNNVIDGEIITKKKANSLKNKGKVRVRQRD